MSRQRLAKLAGIFAVVTLIGVAITYQVPFSWLTVQQKPEQAPPKVYDYYVVVDENTNEVLMYVPIVVNVGDELVSEQNKRYKIVKVEENYGYARFVEDLNLELYKKDGRN
ncbi:MAG: hypothetical protein H6Q72_3569 [Firmicutes bacterium]|nr:hypothetical protein [Bacillota bacterium]